MKNSLNWSSGLIGAEEFRKGVPANRRPLSLVHRICDELGLQGAIPLSHPQLERARQAHGRLYRKKDLGIGGVYAGLAVHLDICFSVKMPHIFGSPAVDPFDWVDITEIQKCRLIAYPEDLFDFIRQMIDVLDTGSTLVPMAHFTSPEGRSKELFSMAAFHNQAAAAVMVQAFDFRGAIQSALLCAELAMKSIVSAHGHSDESIKNSVGHSLDKALKLSENLSDDVKNDITACIENLPPFAASRYQERQWSRTDAAAVVLAAQRIMGHTSRYFARSSWDQLLPRRAQAQ